MFALDKPDWCARFRAILIDGCGWRCIAKKDLGIVCVGDSPVELDKVVLIFRCTWFGHLRDASYTCDVTSAADE